MAAAAAAAAAAVLGRFQRVNSSATHPSPGTHNDAKDAPMILLLEMHALTRFSSV